MKKEEGGEEWTHDRVVLRPENVASPPFTLDLKSEDELQVLGEFVCALSPSITSNDQPETAGSEVQS